MVRFPTPARRRLAHDLEVAIAARPDERPPGPPVWRSHPYAFLVEPIALWFLLALVGLLAASVWLDR